MQPSSSPLTTLLNIRHPIIGGAMYPCSNPELVAAVSQAGGIGIVQPLSLTLVHHYDFRAGLQFIRTLTDKPIGLNLLIEKSSKKYLEKNKAWLEIALEEGVRFFITALGNPAWVTQRLANVENTILFHDVTEKKWAQKAIDAGAQGLICVNNRAGGHAGHLNPTQLFEELSSFGVPLVCAGGIGGSADYQKAQAIGYDGVQLGTRFIASKECKAHDDYKQAILKAREQDIVLTEKITGVPVAVIETPYIKSRGIKPNKITQFLLRSKKTKHLTRLFFSLRSIWQLKKSLKQGASYREYYQAGKSVEQIDEILSTQTIIDQLVHPLKSSHPA